ncbi:hypothetical protein CERZMDRAFT_81025 [Cercospora zeae-maydis SCOH1-5]|uniref:Uncharacterized protein n=1 Tax=Cercospora zeae-maydis SCOH1-5 TaxID=717836 RepID=A0A6A6FU69_9PEZI|nr:hypothetical protein CERZMDRAFT_81025 [Cercospora zeae-maydis SCOH1-5]
MRRPRMFNFFESGPPCQVRDAESFCRRQGQKVKLALSDIQLKKRRTGKKHGIVVGFDIKPARRFAQQPRQRISFFDLPAEIRNTIYHYALKLPDQEAIRVNRVPHLGPPLLSTNVKVREEASIIYYRSNHFQTPDVDCAIAFLKSLCVCALPVLRSIRIPVLHCYGSDFGKFFSHEQVERQHLCQRLLQSGLFSTGFRPDCVFLGIDYGYHGFNDGHPCKDRPISLLYVSRYQFDLLASMVNTSPPTDLSDVNLMRAKAVHHDKPRMLPDTRLKAAQQHVSMWPCKDRCTDCLKSPEAMAHSQVLHCEPELHSDNGLPTPPFCSGSRHIPVVGYLNKHFIEVSRKPRDDRYIASRVHDAGWVDTTRGIIPWIDFPRDRCQ